MSVMAGKLEIIDGKGDKAMITIPDACSRTGLFTSSVRSSSRADRFRRVASPLRNAGSRSLAKKDHSDGKAPTISAVERTRARRGSIFSMENLWRSSLVLVTASSATTTA